jgi:phosphoglycolate phosphatase
VNDPYPSDLEAKRGGPVAAVAFDFDGTLADTSVAVVATFTQTLRELGVAEFAPEQIVMRMGLPLGQVFLDAGVPYDRVDHAVARYRIHFGANSARIVLFPGVLACLQALGAARIPIGITSSRGRESLWALLEQLQIATRFAHVLGEEDALRKKPAPDLVLELAQRLSVPAARMLVVGDTTYDIEMGHAAGAQTCAVSYGSHDAKRLQGSNPHYMLDSLAELYDRIWP